MSARTAEVPGVDYTLHDLQERADNLYRTTGSDAGFGAVEQYCENPAITLDDLSDTIESLEKALFKKSHQAIIATVSVSTQNLKEHHIYRALTLSESPLSLADYIKRQRSDLAEEVDAVLEDLHSKSEQ